MILTFRSGENVQYDGEQWNDMRAKMIDASDYWTELINLDDDIIHINMIYDNFMNIINRDPYIKNSDVFVEDCRYNMIKRQIYIDLHLTKRYVVEFEQFNLMGSNGRQFSLGLFKLSRCDNPKHGYMLQLSDDDNDHYTWESMRECHHIHNTRMTRFCELYRNRGDMSIEHCAEIDKFIRNNMMTALIADVLQIYGDDIDPARIVIDVFKTSRRGVSL